jgi:hypothetical protein
MVLLDIPDRRPAIANCVGSLKPAGLFVDTLHHPVWVPGHADAWPERGVVEVSDYLNEHEQTCAHAVNFHRPLSGYINETIRSGCRIIEIVEPQLRADQIARPEQEILTRIPNYIVAALRDR